MTMQIELAHSLFTQDDSPDMVQVVAVSTPADIVVMPANWTAKLIGLRIFNSNPGVAADVQFGHDSAGFVQDIPDFFCDMGVDASWTEELLPNFEFSNTIQVQELNAAAGGTPVSIEVTVRYTFGNAITT